MFDLIYISFQLLRMMCVVCYIYASFDELYVECVWMLHFKILRERLRFFFF